VCNDEAVERVRYNKSIANPRVMTYPGQLVKSKARPVTA
jgi:hypothetical protein